MTGLAPASFHRTGASNRSPLISNSSETLTTPPNME